MGNNLDKILEWTSLNKYLKMLINKKEKPWLKVSKLVEAQFYQPIGETYQRKITKEKTDHPHQKVNNGEKGRFEFDVNWKYMNLWN